MTPTVNLLTPQIIQLYGSHKSDPYIFPNVNFFFRLFFKPDPYIYINVNIFILFHVEHHVDIMDRITDNMRMGKQIKNALKRTGTNAKIAVARLCDKFFNDPSTDGSEPTRESVIEKRHNPHHGRYSGWGVQKFQQWVMSCSANGDMLTDAEMAEIFTREFPRTKCVIDHGSFPVNYLINMRTQYNAGTHSGMTKRPDKPCLKIIIDASGKRIIDPAWSKRYDPETGNKRDPKKSATK